KRTMKTPVLMLDAAESENAAREHELVAAQHMANAGDRIAGAGVLAGLDAAPAVPEETVVEPEFVEALPEPEVLPEPFVCDESVAEELAPVAVDEAEEPVPHEVQIADWREAVDEPIREMPEEPI